MAFTRNSVAYNADGSPVALNVPRFQTGKFGQALWVEEGTTNLVTNASFETDTSNWNSGGNQSLTRITTTAFVGAACGQITATGQGSGANGSVVNLFTGANGTSYAVSFWAMSVSGATSLHCEMWGGQGAMDVTLTTQWQRFTGIMTGTGNQGFYFWLNGSGVCNLDGVQVEQKAYATSYIDGGSTRAAELLTLLAKDTVNISEGTVEFWLNPESFSGDNAYIGIGGTVGITSSEDENSYEIYHLGDGKLYARFGTGSSTVSAMSAAGQLALNQWTFVTVSWKANDALCIYLNGQLAGSVAVGALNPVFAFNQVYVGISRNGLNGAQALIDDLRISNIARSAPDILADYQSGLPLPVEWYTTLKMDLDGNLTATAFTPTVPYSAASFVRTSIAYNLDGTEVAANVPRFQTGKFGQAVLIEEGTTNILTANQAHPTKGTTGWGLGNSSGCTANLSQVSSPSWLGGGALQAVISGFSSGDLFIVTLTEPTSIPVSENTAYALSAHVMAPSGALFYLRVIQWNSSGGVVSDSGSMGSYSGTESWQYASGVITTAPTTAYISFRIQLQANGTFYFDGLQVEQKLYATSYIDGGSTRSLESLTAPTTGVLYSAQGTMECWINPSMTDNNARRIVDTDNGSSLLAVDVNMGAGQIKVYYGWSSAAETELTVSASLSVGVWYYLAVTWIQGDTLAVYLNGVLLGSAVIPPGTPSAITEMFIGQVWNGTGSWNSLIDELRISNIARSASEIQAGSYLPLPVDENTTYKLSFDGSLNQPWIYLKTDWAKTDYYNADDFNTVEYNSGALATLLQTCGFDVNLSIITSRDNSSLDFYLALNRIEGNIQALYACYGVAPQGWLAPFTAWTYDLPFSYTDTNRMAGNLLALYHQISGILQEYPVCGQGLNICGLDWFN